MTRVIAHLPAAKRPRPRPRPRPPLMRTAPNSPMRLLPKAPLSCCGKSAPSLGVVNSRKALKASRPVLLQRRQRTQPCPLACSESVAVALMQDLRNTVAALESEVALRMADDPELDNSNGGALFATSSSRCRGCCSGEQRGRGLGGLHRVRVDRQRALYPELSIQNPHGAPAEESGDLGGQHQRHSSKYQPKVHRLYGRGRGRYVRVACSSAASSPGLQRRTCTEQPWEPSTSRPPSSKLAIKDTPRANPSTA